MLRLLCVAVVLSGCSNLIVVRGSSNDFLKRKATSVVLNAPQKVVQERLDEMFERKGFRPYSSTPGENGSQVLIYRGSRRVPREAQAYGIELGSWFAARVATVEGNQTEVTLMGKPMVGAVEICSEHDNLLNDIKYVCSDTKVPPDWAGKNLVSGRDETEVVSGVLSDLYERLKH
ncbi:MAG: hypothetical protein JNK82_19655 [Myxococcaceae bacterium]|nr:hypothetical protein [Myxococcaceae bacterium]